MEMLYPMIFAPKFVEKMWGGRKLATLLNKPIQPQIPVGESWELYDFPPGVVDSSAGWVSATLTNGQHAGRTLHELVTQFGRSLHGDVKLVGPHGQFPILIKFLDAREDLSVQVHPPQSYADTHADAHLKNEAWYVVQHDAGARVLKGLRRGVTRESFADSIRTGTCEALLQSIPAKVGDCYYLPSGTVHALGAGCLVAEVQTPSDTTYRVYDFDRVDPSTGNKRALHVEQAMDCIDFNVASAVNPPRKHEASYFTTVTQLAVAPQFVIEKVRMAEGVEQAIPYDQPVVWMMLEGTVDISAGDNSEVVRANAGMTVLLPAEMKSPTVKATTPATWLEVTFPIAG